MDTDELTFAEIDNWARWQETAELAALVQEVERLKKTGPDFNALVYHNAVIDLQHQFLLAPGWGELH